MRLTPEQRERYNKAIATNAAIYKVPPEFQPHQGHKYPPDNKHEFERWFFDTTRPQELFDKSRTYLPVFWTAYWCNNGYGRKTGANRRIQHFVNTLPRDKKYWTICQYDDGCMVEFGDLDIKIFGMSGGRIDYPIPLLCQPHKYEFPGIKKDIFCSFVGGDTHPIRRELMREFEGKPDCYVTLKKHSLEDYCRILARSVFALCPRGYGKSSFRIMEAMHYNAIPIYLSDDIIYPYNNKNLIRVSSEFSAEGIYAALSEIKQFVPDLQKLVEHGKHLFTYEGCKKMILENI